MAKIPPEVEKLLCGETFLEPEYEFTSLDRLTTLRREKNKLFDEEQKIAYKRARLEAKFVNRRTAPYERHPAIGKLDPMP